MCDIMENSIKRLRLTKDRELKLRKILMMSGRGEPENKKYANTLMSMMIEISAHNRNFPQNASDNEYKMYYKKEKEMLRNFSKVLDGIHIDYNNEIR